ncbi:hypothetical protein V494_08662 [Pseudogymnoascus sp. VKM F-4513 (FW-928)]|nr:hypothetical protein V494_08662 [Pseudogymnoascus sp. VKM F-4513 (FW-928)]
MAGFPNFLAALASRLQSINPFNAPPSSAPPGSVSSSSVSSSSSTYEPTVADVLAIKAILQGFSLPPELTDEIIDYAEYWPHTSAVPPGINAAYAHGRSLEDYFVARTLPLGCLPTSPSIHPSRAPAPAIQGRMTPHLFPPTQSESSKAATSALYSVWAQASQPRDSRPCRKIVFKFRSRDQGWGGDYNDRGTYNGSFTWLDVGRERARVVDNNESELLKPGAQWKDGPLSDVENTLSWNLESIVPPLKEEGPPEKSVAQDSLGPSATQYSDSDAQIPEVGGSRSPAVLHHPFLPHDKTLQKNRTATDTAEDYTIVWRYDDEIDAESIEAEELRKAGRGGATGNGEFVRSLEVGDVITVWARARFPGWSNFVEDVKVDIFWAV